MSIIKTIFTGTTQAQRAAEMLSYLQTYAADYFDSITKVQSSDNIGCYIDDVEVLLLPYSSGAYLKIGLVNGAYMETFSAGEVAFTIAYRSENGVMLKNNSTTLVISKNDIGHTVLCTSLHLGSESSGTSGYRFADTVDGVNITTPFGVASSRYSTIAKSAALTATVPAVFDSGHYSEGLCITPYSEYVGIGGILTTSGGIQYAYDGAIALKG